MKNRRDASDFPREFASTKHEQTLLIHFWYTFDTLLRSWPNDADGADFGMELITNGELGPEIVVPATPLLWPRATFKAPFPLLFGPKHDHDYAQKFL